jgi:hypothetical protein
MFGFSPRPVSGPITREGLRATLERKVSMLLEGLGGPACVCSVCQEAAPLTASFPSRRHPQNVFEVVVAFKTGFSASKLVKLTRDYMTGGLKVDCDRFTIHLRGSEINSTEEGEMLQLTPGVANLLDR